MRTIYINTTVEGSILTWEECIMFFEIEMKIGQKGKNHFGDRVDTSAIIYARYFVLLVFTLTHTQ